ncbi:MAG: hypothetical protein WC673_01480 [Candidatus Paceibacterota bacterium]
MKKIFNYFDKLEDRVRAKLSHHPIIYSFIGGVAIVLFWRGVWMTADQYEFLTGPVSILISVVVLLLTGLFASFFIGDRIFLSGLRREKKIFEQTEAEVQKESETLSEVKSELKEIKKTLEDIKEEETKHH